MHGTINYIIYHRLFYKRDVIISYLRLTRNLSKNPININASILFSFRERKVIRSAGEVNSQKSPERGSGRLYFTRKSVQPPLFIRRLISNLNSVHPYTPRTAVDLPRLQHRVSLPGNPLHSRSLRRVVLGGQISRNRSPLFVPLPATSDSFALIRRRDSIIRRVI